MTLTFEPPVGPSFDLDDSREPRVLRQTFGDGYVGRSQDGINHDLARVMLRWENLTREEAAEIWRFLRARKAVESFWYALPFNLSPDWVSITHRFTVSSAHTTLALRLYALSGGAISFAGNSMDAFTIGSVSLKVVGSDTELLSITEQDVTTWTDTNVTTVYDATVYNHEEEFGGYVVTENGVTSSHLVTLPGIAKAASDIDYEAVWLVKFDERTEVRAMVYGTTVSDSAYINVDLAAGTLGSAAVSGTGVTNGTSEVGAVVTDRKKWLAPRYTRRRVSASNYTIEATFEQVVEG